MNHVASRSTSRINLKGRDRQVRRARYYIKVHSIDARRRPPKVASLPNEAHAANPSKPARLFALFCVVGKSFCAQRTTKTVYIYTKLAHCVCVCVCKVVIVVGMALPLRFNTCRIVVERCGLRHPNMECVHTTIENTIASEFLYIDQTNTQIHNVLNLMCAMILWICIMLYGAKKLCEMCISWHSIEWSTLRE